MRSAAQQLSSWDSPMSFSSCLGSLRVAGDIRGRHLKESGRMRNVLVNGLLTLVSVVVCVVLAEVTVRIIDGQSPVSLMLPVAVSSQSINVAGGHLDEVPRASSVERDLFFSDPPPLPNRKPVPADWTALGTSIVAKRIATELIKVRDDRLLRDKQATESQELDAPYSVHRSTHFRSRK